MKFLTNRCALKEVVKFQMVLIVDSESRNHVDFS